MKTALKTTRVLHALAVLLAGGIALAFPAIFFSLQYRFHQASIQVETKFSAVMVLEVINANPEYWQFEVAQLQNLLKDEFDERLPEARRILDAAGHVIAQGGEALAAPVIRQDEPLLDSGRVVGRFEIQRSLRPLLYQTALVAVLGQLLGALVLLLLWIYPLKTLKKALRTLASEKKRAELILNSIGDAVITIDAQGLVLSANPAAEKIFGYAQGEIIGQNIKLLMATAHEAQHDAHLDRYHRTGQAHILGVEREVTARRRDGSTFPIEIHIAEFELEGRRQFLGSMRDITERKQARDEVARLNASLEERVQQRTAQLEAANRELEAFSYSVSHDLRTPLSSIAGFSGLLSRQMKGDEAGERARHYLARIGAGVVQMSELIDSLLKLAQLMRTPLQWGSVDLSAMALAVLEGLRKGDPARVVRLAVQPGLLAQGDARLLRQMLEHLLGNAWKFSGQQPQAQIDFRHENGPDGEPVYVVQDNGTGFDMAYSDKLFGAFQRLHGVAEFSGRGVGLATVHRIITRHGGRIWAESLPGQGATFRFTLGPAQA